jgi:hypothetical protein
VNFSKPTPESDAQPEFGLRAEKKSGVVIKFRTLSDAGKRAVTPCPDQSELPKFSETYFDEDTPSSSNLVVQSSLVPHTLPPRFLVFDQDVGETALDDGDSDREENHQDFWKCFGCKDLWRTTGRVGWEEVESEEWVYWEEKRPRTYCLTCGGVTWKSDWQGEYLYTGRSSFAGMRWVFIGPHMPEAFWDFENEPKNSPDM